MAKIHSEWVESKIYEMKILLDELNSGHDHDHHKVEKQFMDMANQALEAYRVATIFNKTFMNTKAVDVGEGILTVQS